MKKHFSLEILFMRQILYLKVAVHLGMSQLKSSIKNQYNSLEVELKKTKSMKSSIKIRIISWMLKESHTTWEDEAK